MKVLFLYSEYVNYLDGVMRQLASTYGASVHVVSWDEQLLKPANRPSIKGVTFQDRSGLSTTALTSLIERFDPEILYVSGWMDKGYLSAISRARNRSAFTTVCGFDDNWQGTARQRLGSIYFRLYLRRFFDRAWVSGARQYNFARNLGYQDEEIAFNLLSCDSEKFNRNHGHERRLIERKKAFFYVGNFREVKGIDILISAYKHYCTALGGNWDLICIGQGPLANRLKEEPRITVLDYMDSSSLIAKSAMYDVFVFPSLKDQWGVALHEFASLGFPLLSSVGAGSADQFLIDGYNGLTFSRGDVGSLANAMLEFQLMPDEKLREFGLRSRILGATITSEISAASLMSLAH